MRFDHNFLSSFSLFDHKMKDKVKNQMIKKFKDFMFLGFSAGNGHARADFAKNQILKTSKLKIRIINFDEMDFRFVLQVHLPGGLLTYYMAGNTSVVQIVSQIIIFKIDENIR